MLAADHVPQAEGLKQEPAWSEPKESKSFP